jgi:phenylpropionate dioxygenase-like ring-hydroxylating dioxygenase large terminal subunit
VVTLPGGKISEGTVAKATPSFPWNSDNLAFSFRNRASEDRKSVENKQLTLTVKKHSKALAFFDIVDRDRRIAELRESIVHNERLALRRTNRGRGHRPALDLIVSPGVDISLVSRGRRVKWEISANS